MNDAACNMFLNLMNLAVRMMPIFVCLEPRHKNREIIAAVSVYLWVIMVSLQFLFRIHDSVFVLIQWIFGGLFFLVLLIFFQGSLVEKAFLYVSAWLFAVLANSFNAFGAMAFRHVLPLSYGQICVIVSVVSATGFYLGVNNWLKPVAEQLFQQLSRRSCTLLVTYPAAMAGIILLGNATIFSREALRMETMEYMVFYLALSMMILVLYAMILNSTLEIITRRKTEEELQFARQLISRQREHYNQMLEHIQQIRIIKHDFRHHIYALLNMEKEEQTKYLVNLQKEFDSSGELVFCENLAVSGILQGYAQKCRQEQVDLQTRLDISAHIPVDDLTLCIVIGNLLENALEACRKLEENRFIHLNAKWMEDHLVMVVENSYNGHIRKSGDKILSGKKDGGLGMMSIRRILNRPGDDFDIDFNENRFTAMVCIADRTAL